MIHRAVAERSGVRDENGILIWEIQKHEGDALATAASKVCRHYDIAASQKMMDWGALLTACFTVYMPRIADSVDARNRNMKQAAAAPVRAA